MQISKDTVVSFHYTLTDDDGTMIESSIGGIPHRYLHGHNDIIKGLERALEGEETGYTASLSIVPQDGYGDICKNKIITVPRAKFPANIASGMMVEGHGGPEAAKMLVLEVNDHEVVLDGNHPLAGQNLHIALEVIEVRPARESELRQGSIARQAPNNHA